ncbi:hypothetical protein FKP32DRAFT_1586810 [Trametes sanguinea]|nr:hypothetical protein FKP32DRAFT_1586810 [Trametes sanguinea]
MPGGRRNPVQMSQIVGAIHHVANRAKEEAKDAAGVFAEGHHIERHFVDLTFQFIGASGLPKMDVVGTADPYFVAKLDDQLTFVSTVKPNTLSPVWNELWKVKNVPNTATLTVEVLDKDNGNITDDHIGKFSTSVSPGAKECTIESMSLRRNRGTFCVGAPSGSSGQAGAPAAAAAVPNSPQPYAHRVKPAVYTYIIAVEDDSFRFSETGAAFFVDFASKHALHANCAPAVRYSGEFHPRPEGGWENFADDVPDDSVRWELVIDNNSGTYSPDPMMLPDLKELLQYNFPGFTIHALDRNDPRLIHSREACRAYALDKRGVRQEDLQPHARPGEQTLSHTAQEQGGSGEEAQGDTAGTTIGEPAVYGQ